MSHSLLLLSRRFLASSLLAALISTALLSPLAQARVHNTYIDTNSDVQEGTNVKKALSDAKEFLVKREPPMEPFFARFAWGSAKKETAVAWDVTISVSPGRLFKRKLLDAESGDIVVRGGSRVQGGLKDISFKTTTGGTSDESGYDGVELVFWKPVRVKKEDIIFTFKAGDFEFKKTMAELQSEPYRDDKVTIGTTTGQTVYGDVINFDTKRGSFGKVHTSLIFLNWGNVLNSETTYEDATDAEAAMKEYVVTIGLENGGDTKINYLATVGMETAEELGQDVSYEADAILENTGQQITVLSTIAGDTDMIVLALEGTFDVSEVPFLVRGITVRVAEATGFDNFPENTPENTQEGQQNKEGETGSPEPEEKEEETPQPTSKSVEIKNFAFTPSTLEVAVGTKVVWTNKDAVAHTVTFSGDVDGKKVDSGAIDQNKTFEYTFQTTGEYSYLCSFHPSMVAKVKVTAATSSALLAEESGQGDGEEVSDLPGDENNDGVVDDSDVTLDESELENDAEEETGQDVQIAKEVFAKTFTSAEQFGQFTFNDGSGYGVRVLNGSYLWNNTPIVLKALAFRKLFKALWWWRWYVVSPAQVVAIATVSAATISYMMQVQEALFGETTLSEEGMSELQAEVQKQIERLKSQLALTVDQEKFQSADTQQEAEGAVNEDEAEEYVEDLEEAEKQLEQEAEEIAVSSDEQEALVNEGSAEYYDVPQVTVANGKVVPAWFFDWVQLAAQYRYVSGFKDSSGKPIHQYKPSENVTWAQAAKVALLSTYTYEEQGIKLDENKDYPGCTEWWCTYWNAFKELKVDKYADLIKTYPNEPIDRGELAGLFNAGMLLDPTYPEQPFFPDSKYVQTYAELNNMSMDYSGSIENLHTLGCVQGKGDSKKYYPADLLNRAEFGKISVCVGEVNGATAE